MLLQAPSGVVIANLQLYYTISHNWYKISPELL